MTTYPNAKAWAIANGFPNVKPGKGRLPADASTAFQKALKDNPNLIEVKDGPKRVSKPTGPKPAPKVAAPKANPAPVRDNTFQIPGIREPIHPASTKAYAIVDGKKVYTSMSEVCFHCNYSLPWCECHLLPYRREPVTLGPWPGGGYRPVTLEVP